MKKIILLHGVYFTLIIISFISGQYFIEQTKKDTPATITRLKSNFQFVNPILECDTNAVSKDNNLDQLKLILSTKIDTSNDNTSIYYRDMNNGPWFGIKEKNNFSPASLIKVPLMMAYLKKAETDPTILDQEILNTIDYDPRTQNIQPEVTLIPNQKYTIRDLIHNMIIYSDDVSYTLLNNQMPYDELIKVYNDLGVDISLADSNPNGNILSVKAYASFFRILFNASYLNPEMSEYGLKILSQVQRRLSCRYTKEYCSGPQVWRATVSGYWVKTAS